MSRTNRTSLRGAVCAVGLLALFSGPVFAGAQSPALTAQHASSQGGNTADDVTGKQLTNMGQQRAVLEKQVSLLKLQAQIASLTNQIQKLRLKSMEMQQKMARASGSSGGQDDSQASAKMSAQLADLKSQIKHLKSSKTAHQSAYDTRHVYQWSPIGVYGFSGHLTAMLSNGSQQVSVRRGDHFDGIRVAAISDNRVSVVYKGHRYDLLVKSN